VQELGGNTRSVLMPSRMQVVSAQGPNGQQYLLFPQDRALFAQAWNPRTLQLSGERVAIADDVRYNPIYGTSGYSVSRNGVLAYRTGLVSTSVSPIRQMVWYSRAGERLGTVGEPGNYSSLALSPDEKKVAVDRIEQNSADGWDVWILDIGSKVFSRLTRGPVFREPAWSPDSNRIAAMSLSPRGNLLVDIPLTSSDPEPLVSRPASVAVPMWSHDGRSILFSSGIHAERYDLRSRTSQPVLADAVSPRNISISPNGRWVAWQSDDTSRTEVFVASFPSWRQKRQLSSGGGGQPVWRRDSKELFYLAPNSKIMAVQLGDGPPLNPSKPSVLFQSPTEGNPQIRQFAAASGGARFLVMENVGTGVDARPERYHIKLNWYAGLQTPKPSGKPSSPRTH
jgi:eukaryotic-like serine/threonine-protein kinase